MSPFLSHTWHVGESPRHCESLSVSYKARWLASVLYTVGESLSVQYPPQWAAVDAEIKVPSGENTVLKRSPFKAWSRAVYSHTCYAYCQGFLPCLFLPFQSIHLHFFLKAAPIFSCVGC